MKKIISTEKKGVTLTVYRENGLFSVVKTQEGKQLFRAENISDLDKALEFFVQLESQ